MSNGKDQHIKSEKQLHAFFWRTSLVHFFLQKNRIRTDTKRKRLRKEMSMVNNHLVFVCFFCKKKEEDRWNEI